MGEVDGFLGGTVPFGTGDERDLVEVDVFYGSTVPVGLVVLILPL